jgi:monoamine oxidase
MLKNSSVAPYDVVIIGAGIAGLTAAYRLKQAGKRIALYEAKDRVGGRLFNQNLSGGGVVDGGGSWVGPQQTSILALLDELGIKIWPQYTDGRHILIWQGVRKTYKGEMPVLPLLDQLKIMHGIIKLNRMAKKVHGSKRNSFDTMTFGQWLQKHAPTKGSRFFFDIVTATSFGCKPEELSLLEALVHIESAGSLQNLVGVKKAALDSHIAGGSGGLCQVLAEHIGWENIQLNSPVTKLHQSANGVEIHTASSMTAAKKVIIAADPSLACAIAHDDTWTPQRIELERAYTMGSGIKVHFVYKRPFWRDHNLSGQSLSDRGLVRITFDVTPPESTEGVLMSFMGRAVIDTELESLLDPKAREMRKLRALKELAERFGAEALDAVEYIEQDWRSEPYQTGCVPSLMPGILNQVGDAATKPIGHIHFAGAESSPVWEGHMDGAVYSGERAAREVIR